MEELIMLDTETTGIEISEGHRIIEIGCVKVVDRKIVNKEYHQYIQPDRLVGDSFKIHGISDKYLTNKPRFKEIADEFIEFIRGKTLVIHNAPFDVGFLNNEFKLIGKKLKIEDICEIIDSLELSKQQRPTGRHGLDALCSRYKIDASSRVVHGALLDAQILAQVYLALTGGQFEIFNQTHNHTTTNIQTIQKINHKLSATKILYANAEELELDKNYFNQ